MEPDNVMSDNENQVSEPTAQAEAPQEPAAATEAAPEKPAAPSLEETVARLEREKTETYDRMLRLAAEFENFKRRSRRELEEGAQRGRELLVRDLLPVIDNLERALDAAGSAAGGAVDALAQGVRLVEKQMLQALEKVEIRRFDALGEAFDPARHEAIQQLETADFPAGAVARVFARGYTVGQRLLRPAMVAVAKAPAAPAPPPDAAQSSPAPAADPSTESGG